MKKRNMILFGPIVFLMLLIAVNAPEARAADSKRSDKALSEATRRILEEGNQFVLLSIEPVPPPSEKAADKQGRFHNRPVLGKVEIKDPKQRAELLRALYAGVEQYEKGEFAVPSCFIPRHGIRAVAGTNWVDLVICFECSQIVEDSNNGHAWTMVDRSAADIFNRTLREAGVPLAKR